MYKPIILDNILPKSVNEDIIKHLCDMSWFIATEGEERFKRIHNKQHSGFGRITYQENGEIIKTPLNLYAEIIFKIICDRLETKGKINRIFWNLYTPNNIGNIHTDSNDEKFRTILYNLDTTDGYTEVDGVKYMDKMGQAKVYNSNIPHRGVGPKKHPVRFNLNILYY